jgi:acyl-CoA synthetase (AMP-forming)/AMP-acid ligase II
MKSRPRRRPSVHYPARLFHELLEEAADRDGESVALLFDEDTYTFRELDGLANAFAHALLSRGLGGARLALYAGNHPAWIGAFFGIAKAGASAVLLSPAWRQGELEHAFSLTAPKALIADPELIDFAGRAGFGGDVVVFGEPDGAAESFDALVAASPGRRPGLALDPDETELALPFSSGTTGLPKAVRHHHTALVVGSLQWKMALGMTGADCLQTFTPLAHLLGVANVGAGIASRARNRLFARFDLDVMLHSIETDRVTVGIAVAPVALAMSQHPDLESLDLSSLRFFDWCATPVVADVAQRFTDRTGIPWHTAYGCSEAPVLTANPVERPDLWRLDSPGIPVCDVELRIVDPETGEQQPYGEIGEVVVRGPNLMRGYLPESANETAFFPEGWYRTGDLGWQEPEGWVHLTDRLKEMIKVSGFQVAPGEVEAVLFSHEDVVDCAVFGVADALRGQVPHAAVVRKPGSAVDESALLALFAERLGRYKWPQAIHFVDAVPRTASGKALRRVLATQFGSD